MLYIWVPDPSSNSGLGWTIFDSGPASGFTETVTESFSYGMPIILPF